MATNFTLDDEPAQTNSSETNGAESAADEILNAMPEVQQHAIDQHETNSDGGSFGAESSTETDSDGVKFNPEIHTGSKLRSGKWRTRRVSKSFVGKPGVSSATSQPTETSAGESGEAKARAAGAVVANMIIGGFCAFSQDFAPREKPYNERDFLVSAWGDYFVATGVQEISPGWGVAIAMGSYILPRFTMEDTKKKAGAVRTWFALRIAKFKLKRSLKRAGIDAVVEIRSNHLFINGEPAETFGAKKHENRRNG